MPSVFISRDLASDSEFRKLLEAKGIKVEGQSLIDFQGVAFKVLPATDWIFFYSRKAVTYFFDGLKKLANQPNFSKVKFACIGKGTAQTLEMYQSNVHFIGEGKPAEVAEKFVEVAENQRVLFPRAENSRKSIQKLAAQRILSQDLVVYTNKPKSDYIMISRSLLVFTSPLNVQAFFYKNKIQPNQKIVAIGETTASYLKQLGYSEVAVAAKPTELAMANTVLNLIE